MSRTFLSLALYFAASITTALAADAPLQWVELAADGTLSVRAIVSPGAPCPPVSADGAAVVAVKRGASDNDFPVEVCEAHAPATTSRLMAGAAGLPIMPAQVNRIVVIGDTGCRIEGKAVQDCGDPRAWPFAAIAARAAARRPDLVIHVGDYYYRERACPAGRAGCAGSPYGDTWPTWKAELFDPAAPLLASAPWVVVRGNHELCGRGGHGWARLLDPYPVRADCIDRSTPYWLAAGGLAMLMFDSSDADDFLAPPDKVAAYSAQLVPVLAKAPPHSWLLTHRPVWAMAQADLMGLTGNQTVQGAIRGQVPGNLDLVLSGHLHDFISYEFGPERPAQLIVGTGGDTLLRLTTAKIVGAEIDGMPVRRGFADERFGYFVMERVESGWDGTLYGVDEAVLARCQLAGRSLECR
jgi:hypothetical protein